LAQLRRCLQLPFNLILIFAFPFGVYNQQAMFERMGDHLYSQLYQQVAFQPSTGKNKNQPFKE